MVLVAGGGVPAVLFAGAALGYHYGYGDSYMYFFLMSSLCYGLLQDVSSNVSASASNNRYFLESLVGIVQQNRMADHGDERTANMALVRLLRKQNVLRAPCEEETRHTQQTPNPTGMLYFTLRWCSVLHFLGFQWHTVEIRKGGNVLIFRSFRAVIDVIGDRFSRAGVVVPVGTKHSKYSTGGNGGAGKAKLSALLNPEELAALDNFTFISFSFVSLLCSLVIAMIVQFVQWRSASITYDDDDGGDDAGGDSTSGNTLLTFLFSMKCVLALTVLAAFCGVAFVRCWRNYRLAFPATLRGSRNTAALCSPDELVAHQNATSGPSAAIGGNKHENAPLAYPMVLAGQLRKNTTPLLEQRATSTSCEKSTWRKEECTEGAHNGAELCDFIATEKEAPNHLLVPSTTTGVAKTFSGTVTEDNAHEHLSSASTSTPGSDRGGSLLLDEELRTVDVVSDEQEHQDAHLDLDIFLPTAEYKWTVADHRMEGRPTDNLRPEAIARFGAQLHLDQFAFESLENLHRRVVLIRVEKPLRLEERLEIVSAALAKCLPQLDVEFFTWEPLRFAWLSMYATSWAQKQAVNSPERLFVPFLSVGRKFTDQLAALDGGDANSGPLFLPIHQIGGGTPLQPEARNKTDLQTCVGILLSKSKVPQGASLFVFVEEDAEDINGATQVGAITTGARSSSSCTSLNTTCKKQTRSVTETWRQILKNFNPCVLAMDDMRVVSGAAPVDAQM
ncbi:unnamed protein product [Amoebophrya sp. A120]|nr:unnamed protein product [Amoebophrya sp. A120]|eukprot:GSA120T00011350001.1